MSNLPALAEHDPAEIGFPPTLPLEIAAKAGSIKDICATYGISRDQWDVLKAHPVFIQAVEEAQKLIAAEGGAFKIKIRTMAETVLPHMYKLATHSDLESVPANVQADLMKSIIRIAGLDASIDQKGAAAGKAVAQNPLMIQINLS